MKTDEHDDLLILARRGELSEADDRRLREQLASSPETRELYEAGHAFDREASVEPGDEQRIERIERQVQKRLRRSQRQRRSSWPLRGILAAALITGGAVGAVELGRHASPPAPAPSPPEAPPAPPPRRVVHTATAPAPAPIEAPVEEASRAPPPPPPVHVAVKPVVPPPEPTPPVAPPADVVEPPVEDVTALGLFAAANRARVAGDTKETIRLSRQLEDQFPTSKEAISTHLSLAMLYLQQRDGSAAVDEFQRYRAVATTAAMPEALWGESQALQLLGRAAEERAILDELLKTYPHSAYTAAARKRLAGVP